MDPSSPGTPCPRCGVELPPDAPDGLCPACLLAAAFTHASAASERDEATALPAAASGASSDATQRLKTGTVFGPYRIGRLLGRGGMGEVYEAEHVQHGRRVALKVLGQRLHHPSDRARFLREGQLAASINHPHSVYVYGSDVVGDVPVIAMELLPGGTLRDRVNEQGALAPAAAVDVILQVIAGLDAANAAGILHRDIKPANCFVDRDGTVKVGDFGLSISTLGRNASDTTATGTFEGTPQYASPEQLKGEPLDVRSDIYAVGALLYYLLTGQPPFDARDLTDLTRRVVTESPRPPHALRNGIPRGLGAIVLRCLARDPASRPASYAALADALGVFSSKALTPATLGLRFGATAIDVALFIVLMFPLTNVLAPLPGLPGNLANRWATIAALLYFTLLEGVGDASVGKRVFGLRVAGVTAPRAGIARAAGRALFFVGAYWLVPLGIPAPRGLFPSGLWPSNPWLSPYGALLFLTARRRNGFAACQDIVTGTRVVVRQQRSAARGPIPERIAATQPSARHYGPYEVIHPLGTTSHGQLLLGFDRALCRHVWLHVVTPETPPIVHTLRDIGRPGRLRWLAGQRMAQQAWDAYESLDGAPIAATTTPQPWSHVKGWLVDLARELEASRGESWAPRLSLDRVWITGDDRPVLLDFNAAGSDERTTRTFEAPQPFLQAVAYRALEGEALSPKAASARARLPLAARAVLIDLGHAEPPPMRAVVRRLEEVAAGPDRVTRGRRAAAMTLVSIPQIFLIVAAILSLPVYMQFLGVAPVLTPLFRLNQIEGVEVTRETGHVGIRAGDGPGATTQRRRPSLVWWFPAPMVILSIPPIRARENRPDSESRREAWETYVAGRFRATIAADSFWQHDVTADVAQRLRPLARRVLARHPSVSPDELRKATATLHALDEAMLAAPTELPSRLASLYLAAHVVQFAFVACYALLFAFVCKGGVWLRIVGIAVVTQDGKEASRRRAACRAFVAWSPILVLVAGLAVSGADVRTATSLAPAVHAHWLYTLLAVASLPAGALWAMIQPERGVQDRIAGTWLVPR